jgi:RNA 3'-terminal phosphate cyclase (ATP)
LSEKQRFKESNMLEIEGKEGGGQLLRTALSLSLCTGEAFRMEHIRAKRSRPGLMRQHLTAVQAAREVGDAAVHGAEPGAMTLEFIPGTVRGGEYRWSIGTAGSTTLVLQTILPALWLAGVDARVHLEGGTHNPLAPSATFLAESFLPLMRRMGLSAELKLERHGFYPAGGGALTLDMVAGTSPVPLHLGARGDVQEMSATALMSSIPGRIGERELDVIARRLSIVAEHRHIRQAVGSPGPGNACKAQTSWNCSRHSANVASPPNALPSWSVLKRALTWKAAPRSGRIWPINCCCHLRWRVAAVSARNGPQNMRVPMRR